MKAGRRKICPDMIGSIVLVLYNQYGLGNPDALGSVSNLGNHNHDNVIVVCVRFWQHPLTFQSIGLVIYIHMSR
jgi:hypothetical protein